MRLIVCLILATVLFQGALAVTSRASQKKMMIQNMSRSMEKSVFGRAMKNMVTLATKLNYSYDDLEAAFNKLGSSLLNHKESENNLYDGQTTDHNSQVNQFNGEITTYTQEIADGESKLVTLNENLATAEDNLKTQEESLQTAENNLAEAETEHANLIAAHDIEVAEYKQALQFISDAVSSLQDAQNKFDSSKLGEFSFVQVQNSVAAFASKIQKATSAMRSSHQLFIKPVIQAMNQMQSSQEGSSIQVAVNALNDLHTYFANALAQADGIFEKELSSIENRISIFNEQITLLEDTIIPESKVTISNLKSEVAITEEALQTSKNNLEESEEDLANENENFGNITKRHETLVQKITEEYNVVIQAQNIINDAKASQE